MIAHCYVPSGYTVSLSSRTNISLSVLVTYVIGTGFIVASYQKNVYQPLGSISADRLLKPISRLSSPARSGPILARSCARL
jgi:hypothetical protein